MRVRNISKIVLYHVKIHRKHIGKTIVVHNLNGHGFTYIWDRQHVLDLKNFHLMFKKRVIYDFLQKWYNDINMCNYLPMLKYYKINFGYEMYLDTLPSRNTLTKLRLSSQKLRIKSDRYNRNRTPRELRYCILCNVNDVEDEYHFVLVCPAFTELRKKYIEA